MLRDGGASSDARATPDAQTDAAPAEPADAELEDAAVDAAARDAGTGPAAGEGLFVAVGYQGSRLVSRDLGLTWTESATLMGKGDDRNLLRAAAFANGVFVAAGWNLFTSADGKSWTPRDNPTGEWVGGLDYGVPSGTTRGLFVGAGGSGTSIFSSDGLLWSAGKPRDGAHTRSVAFGGGRFMAATDKSDWWATADGSSWSKDSGGHASNQVVWCKDQFRDRATCSEPSAHGKATAYGMGVYVSIDSGGNKLQRSTDGKSWVDVKTIDNEAWLEDVVFGVVP